jgi:hypothetical protein
VPALHVGTDGHLYAELWDGAVAPIRSSAAVNDGMMHQAELAYANGVETLTLDGTVVGTITANAQPLDMTFDQLGTGDTAYWPGGNGGLDPFVGTIDQVMLSAGTTVAGSLTFAASGNSQVVFTPPDHGSCMVDLMAADASGNTGTALGNITVSEVTPTATISGLPSGTTNAGSAFELSAMVSSPGPAEMAAGFNDLWQVGFAPGQTVVEGEALSFNGNNATPLPSGLVNGATSFDAQVTFATTSGGVLLGYQNAAANAGPTNFVPALYVGTDGHLYAEIWDGAVAPIRSSAAVNDGQTHQAELSYANGVETLTLDGTVVGTITANAQPLDMTFDQLGTGDTAYWPGGNGGVDPFVGTMSRVVISTGGAPTSATFADSSGTNLVVRPPQPETLTIGLSATDKDGNTGVQTASIVAVPPPIGLFIDPYQMHTGPNQQTPPGTFSCYALLQDLPIDGPWNITVNYGDGSADQTMTLTNPTWNFEGDATIWLSHDYQTTGTYTLTVSVTNAVGISTTSTASVIIGYGARIPDGYPGVNPV